MRSIQTILIVDDVPKNIQVLGSILMKENYQIAYSQNGREALEMIAKNRYDLVLLDIMMPELDGYEVCEQLRSNNKTKNLPIIFLTAKTDAESIKKGFQLGGNDFLTKPFNAEELLARVKTQLELNSKTQELIHLLAYKQITTKLHQVLEQLIISLDEDTKNETNVLNRLQAIGEQIELISKMSENKPFENVIDLIALIEPAISQIAHEIVFIKPEGAKSISIPIAKCFATIALQNLIKFSLQQTDNPANVQLSTEMDDIHILLKFNINKANNINSYAALQSITLNDLQNSDEPNLLFASLILNAYNGDISFDTQNQALLMTVKISLLHS